jgi:hypothetical protein
VGIEGFGLKVTEWIPLGVPASAVNRKYLETKKPASVICWNSLPCKEPEGLRLPAIKIEL